MATQDIDFGVKVTSGPTVEPVTRDEAKTHLRVTSTVDDTLIDRLIAAAREYVEKYCKRQLITASLTYCMSDWPGSQIHVPRPPLISVTTLKYIDTAGTLQTLSGTAYVASTVREPAVIEPVYGTYWPSVRTCAEAVQLTYSAGYGAAATNVPAPIRQAILLLVGHYYEYREAAISGATITTVPLAVESLLSPYVVYWSPA